MTDAAVCLQSGVVSLIGARANNEDAYFVRETDSRDGPTLAQLVVADGMGGYAAGEVASRLAVEGAAEVLADGPFDSDALTRLFLTVDRRIRAYADANSEGRAMGTTLTLALVREHMALIGHVGDSRAWLMHEGQLQQITSDHSRIGRLVRAGAISESDALGHPDANVLEQALGAGDSPEVDVYHAGVGPGDVLLLSTDGLHGAVGRQEIEDILQAAVSMQEACERLGALALQRGSSDNITVVGWQYPSAAPSRPDPQRPRNVQAAPLVQPMPPGGAPRANGGTHFRAPSPRSPSPQPAGPRSPSAGRRVWREPPIGLLIASLIVGFIVGVFLSVLR